MANVRKRRKNRERNKGSEKKGIRQYDIMK